MTFQPQFVCRYTTTVLAADGSYVEFLSPGTLCKGPMTAARVVDFTEIEGKICYGIVEPVVGFVQVDDVETSFAEVIEPDHDPDRITDIPIGDWEPEPPSKKKASDTIAIVLFIVAALMSGCGHQKGKLGSIAVDAMACIPEVVNAAITCVAKKQAARSELATP